MPGNYNHALLTELFHVQSSRWAQIARQHITVVSKIVSNFVHLALLHAIKDLKVRENVHRMIETTLEANLESGERELARLLEDESRQPITYNHYYTDNIQNSRDDRSKKLLQQSVQEAINKDWNGKLHFQNTEFDTSRLIASLERRIIVNMKEQACSDALTDLNAYYKVILQFSPPIRLILTSF